MLDKCLGCAGSGACVCELCKGKGRTGGWLGLAKKPCPGCDGSGSTPCDVCGGAGSVERYRAPPPAARAAAPVRSRPQRDAIEVASAEMLVPLLGCGMGSRTVRAFCERVGEPNEHGYLRYVADRCERRPGIRLFHSLDGTVSHIEIDRTSDAATGRVRTLPHGIAPSFDRARAHAALGRPVKSSNGYQYSDTSAWVVKTDAWHFPDHVFELKYVAPSTRTPDEVRGLGLLDTVIAGDASLPHQVEAAIIRPPSRTTAPDVQRSALERDGIAPERLLPGPERALYVFTSNDPSAFTALLLRIRAERGLDALSVTRLEDAGMKVVAVCGPPGSLGPFRIAFRERMPKLVEEAGLRAENIRPDETVTNVPDAGHYIADARPFERLCARIRGGELHPVDLGPPTR